MTEHRSNYISSPAALFRLRLFGERVKQLTGWNPYLVGSVLKRRDYRDVDVRIMLDDPEFERIFGADGLWITNGGLTLANMALSALAKEITGMEVDCQIQRKSDANAEYGGEARQPIFMWPTTKPYVPVVEDA